MSNDVFARQSRWVAFMAVSAATLISGRVTAADRTWDGGSAANGNWTTPANWDNDTAPIAGDALTFTTSPRSSSANDFPALTSFQKVTMALGSHQITGNSIALDAGLSFTGGGFVNLLSIRLNNAQTFSSASGSGGSISSAIDTNGKTLTVDSAGTIQFNGVISGSGALVKTGSGRMDLFGANSNTYTGQTKVTNGLVQLFKDAGQTAVSNDFVIGDAVGVAKSALVRLLENNQIPQNLTINSDGQLDVNGKAEAISSLTIDGGTVEHASGSLLVQGLTMHGGSVSTGTGWLTLDGNVTTNASASSSTMSGRVFLGRDVTFDVAEGSANPDLLIDAIVTEFSADEAPGSLSKTGAGLLRLTGDNTYTGPTTISAGELRVDGDQPQSAVTVEGGTLSGTGRVGAVTVTGGVLAPSVNGAPQVSLRVQGNLKLGPSGTFRFEQFGFQAVGVNGFVTVAGTVDLGGSALDILAFPPIDNVQGETEIVIGNDGADPVVGTFNGLPEGASFDRYGQTFYISYKGGDGNDVTLYVKATRTWDGGGANPNWTTAENWVGDEAPLAGDDLIFPQNAARKTNNNNFSSGTIFHSLSFPGAGYTIEGFQVRLAAGITATPPAPGDFSIVSNTIDCPLLLEADQTASNANEQTSLRLRTVLLQGHILTLAGGGQNWITSALEGSAGSLVVAGPGSAVLFISVDDGIPISVQGGELLVRGNCSSSPVNVVGGTLGGFDNASKIGRIAATGGTVQSGPLSSSTLAVTGNAVFGRAVTFAINSLNGSATAGLITPNQLKVTGSVNLGGSILQLVNVFNLVPGDQFVVIDNDGSDAVQGTFMGLPEGAHFNFSGTTFSITYKGGDGNDVVLAVPNATPTPTPTATPSATPTGTPTTTPTATASATPSATPGGTPSATPSGTPTATPSTTLANISTRLRVETGDNALIGGFIVTGSQPKKVIIRAIGPSLPLADALANPTLELHGPNGLIAENDNWVDSPDKQAIIDSTIPPTSDLESAIVATVAANSTGYTAIVRGANDGTGIGVIEVYDLDTSVDSRLANISTRGFVQTGDNVLIAGTIVIGSTPQRVIIRAIGPSLSIAGKMEDPTLELRDGQGTLLQENDNWIDSPNKQAIIDSTIPPTSDLESAIIATLPANAAQYTAVVRGVNNSTGIAVVEIYALP